MVFFVLKFEVLTRHPRADAKNSPGYVDLELRREVQSGNRIRKIIHTGWYLQPQDQMRTAIE